MGVEATYTPNCPKHLRLIRAMSNNASNKVRVSRNVKSATL
jgi:hypothetical protein